MPSNGGNITFGIDFNVNKSGLNDLKKSLQDVQKMTTKDLVGNLGSSQAKKALEEAKRSAAEVEQALKKAYNPTLGTTNITKFNQELKNSGTNLNQVYQRFSKIGTTGQTAFTNLASNVLTTNVKLRETNSLLNNMGTTMLNTVKWGIASSVMNNFTGSVQNAFNYVKALDSSLTDIRIVTGDSRDQMDRFAKSANQAAQSLGRQTKEYTNAALAFYQQGLGDDQVAARTETTLKASNITGADVATMADQLTAVWNGFQIQGEKTNEVVSKLAAVADTSASKMSELATAMSKSASVANNMGVDVDQLSAQIATIIATTRQAPQTVGNALKTIYARINDIKAGTDQAEISLGNYTGKMAQLGVNVLDQNGQLRDTGQVMEEIGQRWGSMTKEQQVYLAQTMAGQRQMNNLIALFDNWDTYTKQLNISLQAQGTLDQKNARYMESLAAHTKEFESAQEGLIQAFANGDSFKGFVDLGTEAVKMMTSLVEGIGGGGNAILALGSIATSVFSGIISKEINSLVTNFQNAKFNAEQLNQVIANTKSVAAIEGISDNKAVQAMIDAQTETQKYYSVMSEAQINHQNDLIKELGLAQQNLDIWEDNKNKAQEYARTISENTSFEVFGKNAQALEQVYIKLDQVDDLIKQVEKSYEAIENINPKFNSLTGTSQDLKNLKASINDVIKATHATGPAVERINRAFQVLGKQGKLTANEISSIKTAVENFIKTADSRQDHLKETLESDGTQFDVLKNKVEAVTGAIEDNNNASKQLFNIDTTVKAIGAIGQLASGMISLSRIPSIWNDENLSSAEKFRQILLSAATSLPMLITAYQRLNSVLKIKQSIQAIGVAFNKKKVAAMAEEKVLTTALTLAHNQNKLTNISNIASLTKEQKAHLLNTTAMKAELVVTKEQIVANQMLQASLGVVAIALAAAAVVALGLSQHMEKVRQDTIETNKTIIEQTKASQQQVDANEQLYKSFSELKTKYQQGLATKEQLYTASQELADAYNLQGAAIANLTGLYEDFSAAAKEAREQQLKSQIQTNKNQISASTQNMIQQARKGSGMLNGNTYSFAPKDSIFDSDEALKVYSKAVGIRPSEEVLEADLTDPQSIIDYYEKLQKAISELNNAGLTGTKLYQDVQKEVNQMTEAYNSAIQAYSANEKNLLALSASQSGIAEAASETDFEKSVEVFRSNLSAAVQQGLLRSDTDIDAVVNNYIAKINTEFARSYSAKEAIENAGELSAQVKKAFNDLPLEDRQLLMQIGFKFDEHTTEGQVKAAAEAAKAKIGFVDVPIRLITDTSATIAAGKDVQKSDFEALQNSFSPEISNMLGDRDSFNNKTIAERIDLLHQVINLQLEENRITIQNADSINALNEAALAEYEDERDAIAETIDAKEQYLKVLENTFGVPQEVIEEEKRQLEQLKDQLKEMSAEDYVIKVQTQIEEMGTAILDASISQVLTDAERLRVAAELIGQGWQVAAENVGQFASLFPELMDSATRYADGSIKLDQERVASVLGANAEIINSNKEVIVQAIDDKVAQLKAENEFHQRKIEILQSLLAGDIDEAEAERQVAAALANYKKTMEEMGVQVNAEAVNQVIANAGIGQAGILQTLTSVQNAIAQVNADYANMMTDTPIKTRTFSSSGASGSANTGWTSSVSTDQGKGDVIPEDVKAAIEEQIAQSKELISANNSAIASYEGLRSQILSTAKTATEAAGGAASGAGGKASSSKGGGGGGGGKDNTKTAEEIDKLKLKDQDVDKYHQIERAIKRIDDYLDAMSGYEEKAIRGAKSDTIDKQVDALEQQKALYEQKIQMMKADLQLQQADLSLLGVQFDEQGNIINYTALMSAYQAQYNALLEQAKLLTGDAQENKLKEASNLKQQLESLKSQMGAYESLQDKIMDAGSAIRDIIDKEEELRIKQFKIEIDTQLEFADAKRDWNEFKKEVIDKIKDDDFLGQARARVQDFFSYYDDQGNGIIQKLTEHVNRTREEAEIIENGGTSSIYGKNQAQALEDLKHYTDELMQNLKDVQEIAGDIHDLYLDTIDKAQDAFDEQIDQYEQIDSIIEHDMNLLELLSPENNEEALAHYYDKRAQNHNQEIDFYRKEADMWKAQLENAEEGTEEWKKFRDNWEASISDLNSAVESAVENLISKYENTISKIVKETKNQILGGDWQAALDEWDKAKWNDDRYLDMGSRATGVLDFMDKVNEAMNGQSPKVQKQLNEFLKKQVDYLNEIPNLRQVDLDIAYKKLEVLQKQMALEDAQEAKTRMRLRRDSQGNYTYQYVADEDDIANKQQQLRDTLEELRQLAKVDISDTMDEVQEKLDEFFEHAQELSQTYYDDQDLLQQKLLELQTAYFGEEGYITLLGMDYHTMQEQLLTATGAQFSVLLGQMGNELQAFLGLDGESASDQAVWTSILALLSPDGGKVPTLFDAFVKDVYLKNFALMSEQNQNLLFGSETGLNPSWNTAIGNMAENYMALTRDVVIPCMQAMINANAVYANDLNILQQVAGVSFGTIAQGIDADIAYTQGLIQANGALIDTYNAQMNAIAGVCAQIANLCAQYSMAEQAAIDAANASLKFWYAANGQTIGDYYSGGTPHATAAVPASAPVATASSGGSGGGGAVNGSSGPTSSSPSKTQFAHSPTYQQNFGELQVQRYLQAENDYTKSQADRVARNTAEAIAHYERNGQAQMDIITQDRIVIKDATPKSRMTGQQYNRFATGGYTGDWPGSEGRLALLDQKELVLNAEDTVNMLNAVKIASGMMERIAGLNSSVLDNLVANRGLSNIETGGTVDSSSHQVINIQADFPNANSADEIKQAFNNLINIASQRASGNRRTY